MRYSAEPMSVLYDWPTGYCGGRGRGGPQCDHHLHSLHTAGPATRHLTTHPLPSTLSGLPTNPGLRQWEQVFDKQGFHSITGMLGYPDNSSCEARFLWFRLSRPAAESGGGLQEYLLAARPGGMRNICMDFTTTAMVNWCGFGFVMLSLLLPHRTQNSVWGSTTHVLNLLRPSWKGWGRMCPASDNEFLLDCSIGVCWSDGPRVRPARGSRTGNGWSWARRPLTKPVSLLWHTFPGRRATGSQTGAARHSLRPAHLWRHSPARAPHSLPGFRLKRKIKHHLNAAKTHLGFLPCKLFVLNHLWEPGRNRQIQTPSWLHPALVQFGRLGESARPKLTIGWCCADRKHSTRSLHWIRPATPRRSGWAVWTELVGGDEGKMSPWQPQNSASYCQRTSFLDSGLLLVWWFPFL